MQLIIFIGGQASGKSTFFKQHFVDSHIRINLDMLRTRHREKLIFMACLEAKQPCVIDNTNPTVADRQNYIQQAKKARFEVIAYYFDSDLDQALARNELREGKAKIAQQGVLATYKKLQLPTWAEGYDQIYQVQLKQDTGFKVEALAKEDVAEEAVENELE